MPSTRNRDCRGNTVKSESRCPTGMRKSKPHYPPMPRPSNLDPKPSNPSRTSLQVFGSNALCKADAQCTHCLDPGNPVPHSHNMNGKL